MREKSAELVACANEQVRLAVMLNDERDRFEEHCVLRIRMLNLLRLRCVLRFVQDSFQTFEQAGTIRGII